MFIASYDNISVSIPALPEAPAVVGAPSADAGAGLFAVVGVDWVPASNGQQIAHATTIRRKLGNDRNSLKRGYILHLCISETAALEGNQNSVDSTWNLLERDCIQLPEVSKHRNPVFG
jgi:hypothetical protein